MTDTPSIRHSYPSAAPTPGNTPSAAVNPVAAPQLNLSELPVNNAPEALTLPASPAIIEGRVISSNPQAQEIRIQTAAGEVVVHSDVVLPPDTKVSVRLYSDQNRVLANITVLRQTAGQPQQLEAALQPPPELKVGQTVMAMLLPAPTPLQTEQLAAPLKKTFVPPDTRSAPPPREEEENVFMPKSLPPAGETRTAGAPDQRPATLGPNLIQKLLTTYFPSSWVGEPDISATPASSAPDLLDNSLLRIAPATLQGKTVQQAIPMPQQLPAPAADTPVKNPEPLPVLPGANPGESLLVLNSGGIPAFTGAGMAEKEIFQPAAPLPKNMYQLTILKIFPPQTPPEQIKAALQGPVESPLRLPPQSAEVEAVTPGGSPILKTADSHFITRTPAGIPVGSTVIFEAAPLTPEQAVSSLRPQGMGNIPPAQAGMAPEFDPMFSTTWPTLSEALQVIQQADPVVAQAFRHSLPTPTAHLAPSALFFMAALRQGAIESWLGGNAIKTLEAAGKKGLIDRLGRDFSKISSQSKELLIDDWRSITIPLLHDDQISQMQFYVRRQLDHGHTDNDSEQKQVTRFILNLSLSRIGEMQLDGFIQKKNFNIVLRTESSLPFEMRQEIMKHFAQGLGQVHMQGGVSFQTRQQGWVTMLMPQQRGALV
ncbi:MAG: hypothetical protein K8R48_03805 [Alphaproteobacteria bacterium]|nr:hypothetical protein [Alphaproteobacteria bacterium]